MTDRCTSALVTGDSFHDVLAKRLYPQSIERERLALFGSQATATLYAVTPGEGEVQLCTLKTGWVARRIPTIESGAAEGWRMEITSQSVDWLEISNVATVKIMGADGMPQFYRVLQVENAMKPGHVYHLRLEAIGQ